MQPLTKPEQYNTCDVGVLPAGRLQAFRSYLENHGCETRDGAGGQHFHVKTSLLGWATLTRARKGQVGTPRWMRAVVDSFLAGNKTAMPPEFWEQFGVTTDSIRRQSAAQSLRTGLQHEMNRRGLTGQNAALTPRAPVVEVRSYQDARGQIVAAVKDSPGTEKLQPYGQNGSSAKRIVGEDRASGSDMTVQADFEAIELVGLERLESKPDHSPQADVLYLQDLRDDFAMHSPVWQKAGESLDDFAARRWEYAAAMMKARPASIA